MVTRLILFALVMTAPAAVVAQVPGPTDSLESFGLAHLCDYLGLRPSDIGFRPDYTEPDSLRLQLIADLMQQPLGMTDYVESLKGAHVPGQPEILAAALFADLKAEGQRVRGRPFQPNITDTQGRFTLAYTDMTLNSLMTKAASYIDDVFPGSINLTLGGLNRAQRRFLTEQLREVVAMDENDEFLSVLAIDSVEKVEEEYVEEFVTFAPLINKDHIVAAGVDCLKDLMPEIRALLRQLDAGNVSAEGLLRTTGVLPDSGPQDSYLGLQTGWKIGGPGNDYYSGDYTFILDLGGDDVYDLQYDPASPHGVIVIDLAGNDDYRSETDFALGSGCLSVGLLLDFEGDDRYRGQSFSLGSGWFGFGLLYDEAGNDRYDGDTHVEGAGTFGLGLLIDQAGRDTYNGAVYAQGFGHIQGAGIVYDMDGSDSYYAGGKYKDIGRYTDHYLSLSQGFGYGLRPWMSGGIGAIIDLKGNDDYQADIFGQGSSYWWSLGIIYDSSGLDHYDCFQYGQGVGTHMTLGLLVDNHGTDFYIGGGVMQGCGHDYSCGILLDRDGDDTYIGRDKVQGDGSANGVGILIDLQGADRYFGGNPAFAQGAGDPRRGFGSIGLLIDTGGKDQYYGPGGDNYYWKAKRRWGGGMDIDFALPDTTAAAEEN